MAIINIRESLLALDKKTSGKYELTTLYEACKLDENYQLYRKKTL